MSQIIFKFNQYERKIEVGGHQMDFVNRASSLAEVLKREVCDFKEVNPSTDRSILTVSEVNISLNNGHVVRVKLPELGDDNNITDFLDSFFEVENKEAFLQKCVLLSTYIQKFIKEAKKNSERLRNTSSNTVYISIEV